MKKPRGVTLATVAPWAELLPECLMRIAYCLTEGVLFGLGQDLALRPWPANPFAAGTFSYGIKEYDFITTTLQRLSWLLAGMGLVCKAWTYGGFAWHLIAHGIHTQIRADPRWAPYVNALPAVSLAPVPDQRRLLCAALSRCPIYRMDRFAVLQHAPVGHLERPEIGWNNHSARDFIAFLDAICSPVARAEHWLWMVCRDVSRGEVVLVPELQRRIPMLVARPSPFAPEKESPAKTMGRLKALLEQQGLSYDDGWRISRIGHWAVVRDQGPQNRRRFQMLLATETATLQEQLTRFLASEQGLADALVALQQCYDTHRRKSGERPLKLTAREYKGGHKAKKARKKL